MSAPDDQLDAAGLAKDESEALDAYSAVVTRVAAELTPRVAALRIGSRGWGGTGSGVVFTADGYVLTNAHVVASSRGGTAAFADGTSAPFRLVAARPQRRHTADRLGRHPDGRRAEPRELGGSPRGRPCARRRHHHRRRGCR